MFILWWQIKLVILFPQTYRNIKFVQVISRRNHMWDGNNMAKTNAGTTQPTGNEDLENESLTIWKITLFRYKFFQRFSRPILFFVLTLLLSFLTYGTLFFCYKPLLWKNDILLTTIRNYTMLTNYLTKHRHWLLLYLGPVLNNFYVWYFSEGLKMWQLL